MPIYDLICESGHVTTKRGGYDLVSAPCACGATARRRPFNHVAIVGETVMKAQSYGVANFEEASAEVDYHYSKAENNGDPVKRPNLWKQGKKKAKAMGAKIR